MTTWLYLHSALCRRWSDWLFYRRLRKASRAMEALATAHKQGIEHLRQFGAALEHFCGR